MKLILTPDLKDFHRFKILARLRISLEGITACIVAAGLYKFPTLIKAMSLSLFIFPLEENRDIISELRKLGCLYRCLIWEIPGKEKKHEKRNCN